MLVWRSAQSNLCGLRIICHSERSEESHIEHREFDSRRDGRPVRPRAIRESPLQKWQKFVILSAAKNLLLCEFLLTEILRYAQDDTSGRAVHAPYNFDSPLGLCKIQPCAGAQCTPLRGLHFTYGLVYRRQAVLILVPYASCSSDGISFSLFFRNSRKKSDRTAAHSASITPPSYCGLCVNG